jgi:GT2 family glycosyltransferase
VDWAKRVVKTVSGGAPENGSQSPPGCVDLAIPFADGLLLVGWALTADGALNVSVRVAAGEAAAGAVARYPRADVARHFGRGDADGANLGFIAFVRGAAAAALANTDVDVTLDGNGYRNQCRVRAAEALSDALRAQLAGQWAQMAPAVLAAIGIELPLPFLAAVSRSNEDPDAVVRFRFDNIIAIPGLGYLAYGWCVDPRAELRRLVVVADGGRPLEVSTVWDRVPRPDVETALEAYGPSAVGAGFIALLRDPGAATAAGTAMTALAVLADGSLLRQALPLALAVDEVAFAKFIFNLLPDAPVRVRQLLDRHVGPAIERLRQNRPRPAPAVQETVFGTPAATPECSIVVPIYGRWDFIEYQLALLRRDPELARHELIYVIDDPRIYDDVLSYAGNIHPIYDHPFKLVYAGRNLGYAGANNLGAARARGEFLLLLNSDVMPKAAGWLGELLRIHKSLPDAGVLAPRLLYEDGSIQHAGMRFARYPGWGDLWINLHPGKGLPAATDPHRDTTAVPAVTGACMLIRTALYREAGGFDEDYLRGDFEDSDLCLKLAARGLKSYYTPRVELYHLERQSQSLNAGDAEKARLTLYNCWRHTQRWNDALGSAHG